MRALLAAALFLAISNSHAGAGDMQLATIPSGNDSVAAKLHYPSRKEETAVQFYCEVGTDGRARNTLVVANDPSGPFRRAVEKAIQQGRFSPAHVNGKPVSVMLGGTVLFLNANGKPTMLVTLATADKTKATGSSNYSQPQMLRSFREIEQRMNKSWTLVGEMAARDTVRGGDDAAEIILSVDANGNLTGTKISFETYPNGGLGAVVAKACEGAKFIPAHANGKPVAGQLNLPINFKMVRTPGQVRGVDQSFRDTDR